MSSQTILVTGIGGNVGQGILRNIRQTYPWITLVGTNSEALSAGNHLCQKAYQVPFSTTPEYLPTITEICQRERVDLIVPSTDYEAYYLSASLPDLPRVACSPQESTGLFLNKRLTAEAFVERDIPFARTTVPSKYIGQYGDIVIKPAAGRGSRDIHINPTDIASFPDDYVVQELLTGPEITVAFYVTRSGEMIGFIALRRQLTNGWTDRCEVTFEYDETIRDLIARITDNFVVRGSCNIQGIATTTGALIPFEINCRISGTNSIRAQFGFEDVRYTVEEYCFNRKPPPPQVKAGAAVRILMDVIYPDIDLGQIEAEDTEHFIF